MAARKAAEPAPPAQIQELERALSGDAALARGYLVRGEERWFREAAIALLVEAARRRGLEISRHDGADPDFDPSALLADLGAPSLFAPSRLVLARNAGVLLKKDGDSDSTFGRAAGAFLRGRSVAGTLVVEAESLRIDSLLAKGILASGGSVLSMRKLYDSPAPWERDPDPARVELVRWLLARAREKSLKLDAAEAVYVAAATGNDLQALDSALETLARRGREGVRATVGWTGAGSPFELAEALLRGDVGAALAGVETLMRSGMREKDGSREVKPEALLAVLFGSLRSKLRLTLAAARGAESNTPVDLPGAPRSREEALRRAALRSAEEWQRMLDDLFGLERRTRTSRSVDANDLAHLALRWRRAPGRIRGRS